MKKIAIRDLDHAIAPAGTGGATLHPVGVWLVIITVVVTT
jgi:hypothetical protein